jgi:hypothetical protein
LCPTIADNDPITNVLSLYIEKHDDDDNKNDDGCVEIKYSNA